MKINKTTVNDIILITTVTVAAFVLAFLSIFNSTEGSYVVVEVNGQFVERYKLEQDGEYILNNGSNILTISEGKAYISDADCPDKTCVKQGAIHLNGQTVVCLPNKLVVKIEEDRGGIDLVI